MSWVFVGDTHLSLAAARLPAVKFGRLADTAGHHRAVRRPVTRPTDREKNGRLGEVLLWVSEIHYCGVIQDNEDMYFKGANGSVGFNLASNLYLYRNSIESYR